MPTYSAAIMSRYQPTIVSEKCYHCRQRLSAPIEVISGSPSANDDPEAVGLWYQVVRALFPSPRAWSLYDIGFDSHSSAKILGVAVKARYGFCLHHHRYPPRTLSKAYLDA